MDFQQFQELGNGGAIFSALAVISYFIKTTVIPFVQVLMKKTGMHGIWAEPFAGDEGRAAPKNLSDGTTRNMVYYKSGEYNAKAIHELRHDVKTLHAKVDDIETSDGEQTMYMKMLCLHGDTQPVENRIYAGCRLCFDFGANGNNEAALRSLIRDHPEAFGGVCAGNKTGGAMWKRKGEALVSCKK